MAGTVPISMVSRARTVFLHRVLAQLLGLDVPTLLPGPDQARSRDPAARHRRRSPCARANRHREYRDQAREPAGRSLRRGRGPHITAGVVIARHPDTGSTMPPGTGSRWSVATTRIRMIAPQHPAQYHATARNGAAQRGDPSRANARHLPPVMAGLDPAIQDLRHNRTAGENVDARDTRGHDGAPDAATSAPTRRVAPITPCGEVKGIVQAASTVITPGTALIAPAICGETL